MTAAASVTASITVGGAEQLGDTGGIYVSFNGFGETVNYDTTSTVNSVASAFAAMFSRDYLRSGLCASATGNTITFLLKSGAFQPVSVIGSQASFQLATSGFGVVGLAAPVFSPAGGSYTAIQPVTMAATASGAVIHYTTDGTTPTSSSAVYSTAIAVSSSVNLKAIAVTASGMSSVASASYVVALPAGIITTIAGDGIHGYTGDGGPATGAEIALDKEIALDAAGDVYIADNFNEAVREVTPNGIITTAVGQLVQPADVAFDSLGNLYIADQTLQVVWKVDTAGNRTIFAGTIGNPYGPLGDGGPATSAVLSAPTALAVDTVGNVYIADAGSARIRKVTRDGLIATVAGNGTAGFSGDGGPATNAELGVFSSDTIAVDGAGNLFIADDGYVRVRKVNSAGIINTVAGNGSYGSSGDGGPATSASLYGASGVAVDAGGNLYVSGGYVRKIDPSGTISTIAGSGSAGYSGDGGSALLAQLNGPAGLKVDGLGNLYIVDKHNARIRKVTFASTIPQPSLPVTGTPSFAPGAGTYTSTQSVSITSSTPGATIYYTTSGSAPTASPVVYSGPVTVGASETLNAFALATGSSVSGIASATFAINVPQPIHMTFTVGNVGTAVGTVSGFTIGGTNAADFQISSTTCESGLSLLSGLHCSVTVSFLPLGPGLRTATLTIYVPGTSAPVPIVIPLSGSGS